MQNWQQGNGMLWLQIQPLVWLNKNLVKLKVIEENLSLYSKELELKQDVLSYCCVSQYKMRHLISMHAYVITRSIVLQFSVCDISFT